MPQILIVPVQQNVSVEIGLLKSIKKTLQSSNKNLMAYVLLYSVNIKAELVEYKFKLLLGMLKSDKETWRLSKKNVMVYVVFINKIELSL